MTNTAAAIRLHIRLTVVNAALLVLVGGATLVGAARSHEEAREISVERLNIVGTNGRPVLVLANRARIPGPTFGGKEYPRELADGRSLVSGMIFFNEQGDEVGGLIYNGFKKGQAATDYGALAHLSFDQWKQNQVLALQYNDHGKSQRAGLMIWDRPTDRTLEEAFSRTERMRQATGAELERLKGEQRSAQAAGADGAQRMFVGSRDRVPQVELSDSQGRVRARIYVGSDDNPHLDFLDEHGAVVASYPPKPG